MIPDDVDVVSDVGLVTEVCFVELISEDLNGVVVVVEVIGRVV